MEAPERISVRTPALEIAVEASGPAEGAPVVLLHGFPYDPRGFDAVVPALVADGRRVLVPFLRGFGPTRYRSDAIPRSGQQAALARDLLDLLDALGIGRATLAGYDWGGRAACIVAALHPGRVRALVTGGGYNIQDIARAGEPVAPEAERRLWYQYYLHGARGRAGLEADRAGFARLLWAEWSPRWRFDEARFRASAAAFDNPGFVDTVVHSYRHRFGLVSGDPALDGIEAALAGRPAIAVPTISLCGTADGVSGPPPAADADRARFTAGYERRILEGVGHAHPYEAPGAVVAAIRDLSR